MRIIDVRYNLEYVGFKIGMDKLVNEDKLRYIKKYTKDEIMDAISRCGCPHQVDFTLNAIHKTCRLNCWTCWEKEVK